VGWRSSRIQARRSVLDRPRASRSPGAGGWGVGRERAQSHVAGRTQLLRGAASARERTEPGSSPLARHDARARGRARALLTRSGHAARPSAASRCSTQPRSTRGVGEEAKPFANDTGPTPPTDASSSRRTRFGVTAGITPWNFPRRCRRGSRSRRSRPVHDGAEDCRSKTPLSTIDKRAPRPRGRCPKGCYEIVTGSAADAPKIGGS